MYGRALAKTHRTEIYVLSRIQVGTEALKEAFQDAGEIVSAVVMRDQAGTSRGFGFVNFEKPEAADKAVADFNGAPNTQGTWLVGHPHPLLPLSGNERESMT